MATEKREKQVIQIRKGLNGWQVSECYEDERFFRNAESIKQIKAQYDYEIKHRLVKFIMDLDLHPEGEEKLINRRITVNVLNLGILDNSSTSILMRNLLLAFSQFERDMIVERTQEGREIAKTKDGYREG